MTKRPAQNRIRLWAVAFWLLVWQIAAVALDALYLHGHLLLPTPVSSLLRLAELAVTADFWAAIAASAVRIIGGFLNPTSGTVIFDGQCINEVPPYKRQINTVFQRYALFPHLNVFDNIAFGLRVAKLPKEEIEERVNHMLEVVSLKGYGHRAVSSLSGGQQQRVAIARALVNQPKVLLLDEPLGALDLRLRKDMQNELKRIQQTTGITFIYVTHDQEEALSMSDTVVVMDKEIGRAHV